MASKNVAQGENFTFTHEMDECILDSFLYQASIGQRPGGTFTSVAYTSVLMELRSKFPESTWSKEKFKSRLKYVKGKFSECYDSFRNVSKSGWGFNPVTKMWDLEEGIWNEIIKVNPKAANWKNKSLPLFEKLAELFGKDRETGNHVVTAAEIRERRKFPGKKQGQLIKEIDLMVFQNEAEIEEFNNIGTCETSPPIPNADFGSIASEISTSQQCGNNGTGNKRKWKIDVILEACGEMLSTNIDKVILSNKRADPKDVLKCLEDIDFDQRYKHKAYVYLSRNRVDYDIIIGLPLNKRGPVLWDMLVEAQIIGVTELSPYDSSFM